MADEIILYSAALCGDCQKLKAYMDEHGIAYELRDIKENPDYGDEVLQKTGKLGVPFIVRNGEWIRGYQLDADFTDEFAESLFA